MISRVLSWNKAKLYEPRIKQPIWLQLVRSKHVLCAHTSIFWSHLPDFMLSVKRIISFPIRNEG